MPVPAEYDPPHGIALISDLADRLSDAEQALVRSIGPETDVVFDSKGRPHLMPTAQVALQQSEERFRTLFEKDTGVYFLLGADGAVLHESPSVAGVLGHGPGVLLAKDFFEFVDAEDRSGARAAFSQLIGFPDEQVRLSHRFTHEDGNLVWLEGTGTNLLSEPGIRAVVFALHDVTERVRTETALRESQLWLKAIFDHAAVGIAEVKVDTGRFIRVNQRFCDLLGYTHNELTHLSFTDVTHPMELGQDLENIARLRSGSAREFSREKRYLRKDGTVVWANVAVSAVAPLRGKPTSIITVAHDITHSKRMEEHFMQAQKMEALGQFSGGMAHDFNNILTAIMGYSELALTEVGEGTRLQSHIRAVLTAGNRAADLVRQILTFSRQEPQARRPLPLQPIVTESVKLLRAMIPSTVSVTASIDASAPTVLADANQIHQVLTNLGVNAWHAMKDGGGTIKVGLLRLNVDEAHAAQQPGLRPGLYARISVSDSGCGMDEATRKRIFEPFFTTKGPGEGTGLGLSVVHGIMDNHEGAITVYSNPGEGSIFHLYFPAHESGAIIDEADVGEIPRGSGERVLVVDDEKILAVVIQKALSALGYNAEYVLEPATALAMVRASPGHFALVITDQTMPAITGLSLSTQIHRTMPVLPIILMTGFSAAVTPERVEAAGVHQVLLKPTSVRATGRGRSRGHYRESPRRRSGLGPSLPQVSRAAARPRGPARCFDRVS